MLVGETDQVLPSGAHPLFQSLELHSALYMLHQCGCLRSLHQTDVLSFLTSSPYPLPAGADTWSPTPRKTVKFNLEEDKSQDPDQTLNIDHERDCAVYLSYSAMKNFMDAISFCSEAETWRKFQKVKKIKHLDICLPSLDSSQCVSHRPLFMRSSSNVSATGSTYQESFSRERSVSTLTMQTSISLDSSAIIQEATEQMELLQQDYEKRAMQSLNAAKENISKLYPLKYRVEVLENMFSLLFVTHEDVQDHADHSQWDSGDEYAEDKRRSWDSSNLTGTNTPNLCSLTGSTPIVPQSPNPAMESTSGPLLHVPDSNTVKGECLQKSLLELDLKENCSEVEGRKRGSGAGSTNSTRASSSSMYKLGFLANEFIVRDMLHILKGLLVNVSAEIYTMHSPSEDRTILRKKALDQALPQCMKCSIDDGKLQMQVNRLTQYVSEAMWRFQLVSRDYVPKEIGSIPTGPVVIQDSDSEDNGKENLSSRDSENYMLTDGSVSASSQGRRHKRHRSKASRSKGQVGFLRPHGGFIPRMLASKETLLNMSLRRGKFTQADQVLKIFNMEDSSSAHEVSFAERFASAVKKLQDHDSQSQLQRMAKESQARSGVNKVLGTLAKPSLANIRNVAAAGIASTSVSNVVNNVLGLAELPSFSPDVITELRTSGLAIGAQVGKENIPAMVVLDLACSGSRSVESSMNLIDMAQKRMPVTDGENFTKPGRETKKGGSSKQASLQSIQLLGPSGFLKKITKCYKLPESFPEVQEEVLVKFYKRCITAMLTTVTIPIEGDHLKMYASAIISLDKELKRGKKAVNELEQRLKYMSKREGVESVAKPPKPLVRMSIKQLAEATKERRNLPIGGLAVLFFRHSKEELHHNIEYLRVLYDYVRTLATLMSKWLPLQPDQGHMEYFTVLYEAPTTTLGNLLFISKVPPQELVEISSRLQINLCHVIVKSCCPSMPCAVPHSSLQQLAGSSLCILNRKSTEEVVMQMTKHPEVVVRCILTNMVQFMKEAASRTNSQSEFTLQTAYQLLSEGRYSYLEEATKQLQNVDLGLLTSREEEQSFYGNLVNLMTLHALLREIQQLDGQNMGGRSLHHQGSYSSTVLSDNAFLPPSQAMDTQTTSVIHSAMRSSPMGTLLWECSVAYNVGQLGLLRLFDLKHHVLRRGLKPSGAMKGLLTNRSLDLCEGDPWFKYGTVGDSRLSFLMADGTRSSPCLQVLSPELVRHQLRQAVPLYLQANLRINVLEKKVYVPKLIVAHQRDFITTSSPGFHSPDGSSVQVTQQEALLEFILTQVRGQQEEELREVMTQRTSTPKKLQSHEPTLEVIVEKRETTFGYMFEYPTPPKSERRPSLGANKNLSDDPFLGSSTWNQKPQVMAPCHKLTQPTLDYLKMESELVATVTSLVAEEGLDDCLEEHYQVKTPEEETKKEEVMKFERQKQERDVGYFKYQKLLRDYPALQRFLMLHRVPLLRTSAKELNKTEDFLWDICHASLNPELRTALLSSVNSSFYQHMLFEIIEELAMKQKWALSLNLLDKTPWRSFENVQQWSDLKDHILCCAINSSPFINAATDGPSLPSLVAQINSLSLKCRVVLSNLKNWEVKDAIHLLCMCCRMDAGEDNDDLVLLVKDRLHQMKVYQRITDCARKLLLKLSTMRGSAPTFSFSASSQDALLDPSQDDNGDWPYHFLEQLCSWQQLEQASRESPGEVLETLLQCNEYELAAEWAQIFDVNPQLTQQITESQCLWLLERDVPDFTRSFTLLENLLHSQGGAVCHTVCRQLLARLSSRKNMLFVSEFMLGNVQEQLDEGQVTRLLLQCIGCRALLQLPEKARSDYDHLVEAPLILLEQLLMNMKVEWAGMVLDSIRFDLHQPLYCTDDLQGLTFKACNELVVTYAKKALEFAVVQNYSSGSASRSASRMSTVSLASQHTLAPSRPDLTNRVLLGNVLASTAPPARSTMTRSDTVAGFRPSSSLKKSTTLLTTPQLSSLGRRGQSSSALSGLQDTTPTDLRPLEFVMPPEPPSKENWVPDSAASVCMVCNVERFSMFNRRHHCRRCGRVVCASCSSRTTVIRGSSARTCDDCHKLMHKTKDQAEEQQEKIQKLREKLTGLTSPFENSPSLLASSAKSTGGIQITVGSVDSEGDGGSYRPQSQPLSPSLPSDYTLIQGDCQYVLTLDEEYNHITRDEFYYDSAPSTSLCLSILEQHSDRVACANVILDLCDTTSTLLQPIAPGVPNPEVDYGLIISMLQYLLLHAKVKFVAAGDNPGLSQCETYMDRVQLLQLLVTSNCGMVPSIHNLTKQDALWRLRDKLIEEEQWSVAMEISTKCGLDPSGVWFAWGMVCLKVGDFAAARAKFAKCLKVPSDKNQLQGFKQISDIVQCLETSHTTPSESAEALLAQLKSVKDLLAEPAPRTGPHPSRGQSDRSLDSDPHLRECKYYLDQHGTHTQILDFYKRHGALSKATHYVLNKRVSPEAFIEGLVQPCLASGDFSRLQDQMSAMDPSLERWNNHLTALCRHLMKTGMMHVLYDVQLFMKDFIRAAQMCINTFYLQGAFNYLDLHARLPNLYSAKQHLEAYLDERHWGQVARPTPSRPKPSWGREGGGEAPVRMILTPGEVTKYIRTTDLQVEVTKFMQQYHANFETLQQQQQQQQQQSRSEEGASGSSDVGRSSRDRRASLRGNLTQEIPTLFGSSKMKSEVASLVMKCGNNVHDGYGLAFRIIQDFKLDSTFIYTHVGRHFARHHDYHHVRQLLGCIKDSGMCTDQSFDEVIGSCVRVVANEPSESKEAENLIKMIRGDANKINAYMLCGKLKSAYLMAVKAGSVEDVQRIAGAAERSGQAAVHSICVKYLHQKGLDL